MKKPKSNPTPPASPPEPAAVVESPHDQIKANLRETQAEYTSRMKYTIIGSPAPRGRAKAG
jgi:hypothetical protein